MRRSFASTSVLALTLACGDPGDIAPAEFESDSITVACERAFACCSADEIREEFAVYGERPATFEECVAILRRRITGAGIEASVGSERVAYDPAAAMACLDEIRAASCDTYRGGVVDIAAVSGACRTALTPLVPAGGLCTNDFECETGLCDTGGIGDGNCETIPGAGEPCTYRCADGYYCTRGECVALLADGASCIAANECANGRCEGADPRAGVPGTCAPIVGYCDGMQMTP